MIITPNSSFQAITKVPSKQNREQKVAFFDFLIYEISHLKLVEFPRISGKVCPGSRFHQFPRDLNNGIINKEKFFLRLFRRHLVVLNRTILE